MVVVGGWVVGGGGGEGETIILKVWPNQDTVVYDPRTQTEVYTTPLKPIISERCIVSQLQCT